MTMGFPERRIPSAAPNPAPAETPRISGETRGFLKSPWNEAPAMESPPPTSIAATTRGSRIRKMTVCSDAPQVCSKEGRMTC